MLRLAEADCNLRMGANLQFVIPSRKGEFVGIEDVPKEYLST